MKTNLFLRLSLLLSMMLINIHITYADTEYEGGWVFFDGHLWDKGYNIYFCVGKENAENHAEDSIRFYKLGTVRNTQRFYSKNQVKHPKWDGANYFAVIATDEKYTSSTGKQQPITLQYSYDDIKNSSQHYTAQYTDSFTPEHSMYIEPLTKENGSNFTIRSFSQTYVNYEQKLELEILYQNDTICLNKISPAKIHSLALPFDGDWNGPIHTKSTINIDKGETDNSKFKGTNNACISSSVKLSCAELHDAYEFLGWWNDTMKEWISHELECSYEALGVTTVYARFKPKEDYRHRLYLDVSAWQAEADDYRYAAYVYNDLGESEWVDFELLTCTNLDNYYIGHIPAKYHSVRFCKMDRNSELNDYTHVLAQASDTLITLDERTCYIIGNQVSNNEVYEGKWNLPPLFDVTLNIQGKGFVTINDSTYSVSTVIPNVILHTPITTITPADRWAFVDSTTSYMQLGCGDTIHLTEGTLETQYEICGSTTINIHFKQVICEVQFETNLPTEITPDILPKYIPFYTTLPHPDVREVTGYLFEGWYKDENFTERFDFNAPITEDIVMYGQWLEYEKCIFFKNNVYWDRVYVYTFDNDVWDDNNGVQFNQVQLKEFGEMNQMGKTDIFFIILKEGNAFSHIAFSDVDMHEAEKFQKNYAIYRIDHNSEMPLFIPLKGQEAEIINDTKYQNQGIWMKYKSPESGYYWSRHRAEEENISFDAQYLGNYSYVAQVTLAKNDTVKFKVKNLNGEYFGHQGVMTLDDCSNWQFNKVADEYTTIYAKYIGIYKFIVYFGNGKVEVSLDYPANDGDYRIVYTDETGKAISRVIRSYRDELSKNDTVSFFVRHDKKPKLHIEHCHWRDERKDYMPQWDKDHILTDIYEVENYCPETGVYNFIFHQKYISSYNIRREILVEDTHKYAGDYYIRSNAAEGGWTTYKIDNQKMTHSSYAEDNEDYNYYYYRWANVHEDVKFTIANDYSTNLSDTLVADTIISYRYEGEDGCLPKDAHVRFAWNSHTNELSRAYIPGYSNTTSRYLVLEGNEQLKDASGNTLSSGEPTNSRYGLEQNEEIFADLGDAKYQVDVTANTSTQVKVSAKYNDKVQYFKGATSLLQGDDEKNYKTRLIYDFRSNQLLTGWLPEEETVDEPIGVGSNMLLVRRNHERANQVAFKEETSTIETIDKVYSVMSFTKEFIKNDTLSSRMRGIYWISFPYNVRLSDVFGFGEYGKHWIIQYYDGAERAEKGLFIDSGTYWKYITDTTDVVLEKGVGYVLVLDLEEVRKCFINDVNEVRLYFPSNSKVIISNEVSIDVPAHQCKITNRKIDHTITDSHWNLIGVPCYADINNLDVTHEINQEDVTFYYEYDAEKNVYTTTLSQANFQTMYAYMVQYTGTINWSKEQIGPYKMIAQHNSEEKYTLCLKITNDTETDHTFIQMKELGATLDFDMNQDLTKIINSGTNIYTLISERNVKVAGNVLPIERVEIPIGITVEKDGDYIINMPDGTDKISVALFDKMMDTKTNLLLSEYAVYLEAGTYEGRFYLVVEPEKVVTQIEDVVLKNDDVKKYLIDGRLCIQINGNLYDILGRCWK